MTHDACCVACVGRRNLSGAMVVSMASLVRGFSLRSNTLEMGSWRERGDLWSRHTRRFLWIVLRVDVGGGQGTWLCLFL
jgi:hypothetical protein